MQPTPARSLAPEDWSHVRETINMLCLAVCQIEATLTDSNSAIDFLTQSFTRLAQHSEAVVQELHRVQKIEDMEAFKQDILDTSKQMSTDVGASIQAFQFYDRVSQRLDHVARGLESVSALMGDSSQINDPEAWRRVQETVRESYTMEAERIMFEFIIRGGSVRDALQIYRHHFEQNDTGNQRDDVQLF
jgi:hypothetical protein